MSDQKLTPGEVLKKWDAHTTGWTRISDIPMPPERGEVAEALRAALKGRDELEGIRKDLLGMLRTADARTAVLLERIRSLFSEIKHGDGEHQQWLSAKIYSHFDGYMTDPRAEAMLARLKAAEEVCEATNTLVRRVIAQTPELP